MAIIVKTKHATHHPCAIRTETTQIDFHYKDELIILWKKIFNCLDLASIYALDLRMLIETGQPKCKESDQG